MTNDDVRKVLEPFAEAADKLKKKLSALEWHHNSFYIGEGLSLEHCRAARDFLARLDREAPRQLTAEECEAVEWLKSCRPLLNPPCHGDIMRQRLLAIIDRLSALGPVYVGGEGKQQSRNADNFAEWLFDQIADQKIPHGHTHQNGHLFYSPLNGSELDVTALANAIIERLALQPSQSRSPHGEGDLAVVQASSTLTTPLWRKFPLGLPVRMKEAVLADHPQYRGKTAEVIGYSHNKKYLWLKWEHLSEKNNWHPASIEPTEEYQPRSRERLIEILESESENPRSWQREAAAFLRLSPTKESGLDGGWQDISTAPKDGQFIWLAKPSCIRVGFWSAGKQYEHMGSVGGGWRDFCGAEDCDGMSDLSFVPTNWQPLPLPPTNSEERSPADGQPSIEAEKDLGKC